jgi:transposase
VQGDPDVKRYDEEFKRNAVDLLLSGERDLKPLAQELGVNPATMRYWRDRRLKELDASSPQGPPRGPTPLESMEELVKLRIENEKLKRQRDILKKALGIISEQSPGNMP